MRRHATSCDVGVIGHLAGLIDRASDRYPPNDRREIDESPRRLERVSTRLILLSISSRVSRYDERAARHFRREFIYISESGTTPMARLQRAIYHRVVDRPNRAIDRNEIGPLARLLAARNNLRAKRARIWTNEGGGNGRTTTELESKVCFIKRTGYHRRDIGSTYQHRSGW